MRRTLFFSSPQLRFLTNAPLSLHALSKSFGPSDQQLLRMLSDDQRRSAARNAKMVVSSASGTATACNNLLSSLCVSNPVVAPRLLVRQLQRESAAGTPSKMSDVDYATLLLRTAGQLCSSLQHASDEAITFATSVSKNSFAEMAPHKLYSVASRRDADLLRDALECHNNNNNNNNSVGRGVYSLRARLRALALLKSAGESRALLDQLLQRKESKQADFHSAMYACRTSSFPTSSPSQSQFELAADIYLGMLKNGFVATPTTVVALASAVGGSSLYSLRGELVRQREEQSQLLAENDSSEDKQGADDAAAAAMTPDDVERERNVADARTVHGVWMAMLLQRSAFAMDAAAAARATAAVVAAIGRAHRGDSTLAVVDEIEVAARALAERRMKLEAATQKRQKKLMNGAPNEEEQQHPLDFFSDVAASLAQERAPRKREALPLIEQLVKELLDAMPQRRSELGADPVLLCSIATALRDLGEYDSCARMMMRMFSNTVGLTPIEQSMGTRLEPSASASALSVSRTTQISVAAMCHFVDAPLYFAAGSGLIASSIGKPAEAAGDDAAAASSATSSLALALSPRAMVAAALESFVGCTTVEHRPLPPSATNTLLLSLIQYAVTLEDPSSGGAPAALQAAFFVGGLLLKRSLGFDGDTLALLLRAAEATALVSIAVDAHNTVRGDTCAALLAVAARLVAKIGVSVPLQQVDERSDEVISSPERENRNICIPSAEAFTPLTFLGSLARSILSSSANGGGADEQHALLAESLERMEQLLDMERLDLPHDILSFAAGSDTTPSVLLRTLDDLSSERQFTQTPALLILGLQHCRRCNSNSMAESILQSINAHQQQTGNEPMNVIFTLQALFRLERRTREILHAALQGRFFIMAPNLCSALHSKTTMHQQQKHMHHGLSALTVVDLADLMDAKQQRQRNDGRFAPLAESQWLQDDVWASEGLRLRLHKYDAALITSDVACEGETTCPTMAQRRDSIVEPNPFEDFCQHVQPALVHGLSLAQSSAVIEQGDPVQSIMKKWSC